MKSGKKSHNIPAYADGWSEGKNFFYDGDKAFLFPTNIT
jgi:hypothetical protein